MKKIFVLIFSFIFFSNAAFSSNSFEISDIYIEAQGNNKYEARIKAHEKGMYRAILIIADKIGINYNDIKKITYPRMKQVFTVSSIINEVQTDESYSATVSYKYDPAALNKTLLDYGSNVVDEKFYEYLILPIFKQRKVLNIWDESQIWNKLWAKERKNLEQNRLFYPQASRIIAGKINERNIFNYSHSDFLADFPHILFKKVMLLICEYFTDVNNGESVMVVNSVIIDSSTDKNLDIQEYPIENQDEIPLIMEDIINQTIRDYGKSKDSISQVEKALNFDNIPVKEQQIHEERTIMLNIEIFDSQELATIKHKLQNVTEISSFIINHDYEKKYNVVVKTSRNEAELAEGFYLNGLSFKVYGSLYSLIDIKEGG